MSYFRDDIDYSRHVSLSRKTSTLTVRQYFEKHMPYLSKEKIDEHVSFIENVEGYEHESISVPVPMSYDCTTRKLKIGPK